VHWLCNKLNQENRPKSSRVRMQTDRKVTLNNKTSLSFNLKLKTSVVWIMALWRDIQYPSKNIIKIVKIVQKSTIILLMRVSIINKIWMIDIRNKIKQNRKNINNN
jgi:hypothetical protein